MSLFYILSRQDNSTLIFPYFLTLLKCLFVLSFNFTVVLIQLCIVRPHETLNPLFSFVFFLLAFVLSILFQSLSFCFSSLQTVTLKPDCSAFPLSLIWELKFSRCKSSSFSCLLPLSKHSQKEMFMHGKNGSIVKKDGKGRSNRQGKERHLRAEWGDMDSRQKLKRKGKNKCSLSN